MLPNRQEITESPHTITPPFPRRPMTKSNLNPILEPAQPPICLLSSLVDFYPRSPPSARKCHCLERRSGPSMHIPTPKPTGERRGDRVRCGWNVDLYEEMYYGDIGWLGRYWCPCHVGNEVAESEM